ncbi:MAG: bifunctional diaminohydroxyphosphoribosylaminopyrimidine deaminase/5-amino-6-(5-phosphoribosylamino)uracil reductase RibD [Elusimicrobia bacterium]|nr:bifunctional diaminohydroxyphosphoribosylaminopyrimidine deaminase/5-amino-6-(5-phosphoribosylamino)uracil reductase RibD [Candidatus Obscuribacterium magneticum]
MAKKDSPHIAFMQRALSLAARGKGRVSPNPCVGCVIVNNGRIVGEGAHKFYGGPHAEIEALKEAWASVKGGTVYINLEPCSHWGKTPPCAPVLIQSGIKRIYIATRDPNPLMQGRSIRLLKRAGLKVHVGLEKEAAEHLNRPFFTWMKKKRPYVILKMAMTIDGKIATRKGQSKWISSPASRRLVHKLRTESDAVIIGANTAIRDNPSLTSHHAGRDPLRFVLDPHLRTPPTLRLYNDARARTFIITSVNTPTSAAAPYLKRGVQVIRTKLKNGEFDLSEVLKIIAKLDVSQLFIEGGGGTAWSFIHKRLVDEVLFFISPLIFGGKDAKTPVEGPGVDQIKKAFRVKSFSIGRVGPDILVKGYLKN